MIRDLARPDTPDKIIADSEPLDEYQRKTQSPLIWLNMRKTKFPRIAQTWSNFGYTEEAKQRLGQMDTQMASLSN